MKVKFWKYQGTGNDFVMIDNRSQFFNKSVDFIRSVCDRRFGIGADGLICIETHETTDFRMVYFNSDGNESTFCGNGGRCVVAFAQAIGVTSKSEQSKFTARDGVHHAERSGDKIRLEMGDVSEIKTIGDAYELFTGSPHFVKLVENVDGLDVKKEGAAIRYSESYKKEGINVNFVQIARDLIHIRTYERGVEDETLSCGTGVTAAAIVGAIRGMKGPVTVQTSGGPLEVGFTINSPGQFVNIYLEGPAELVFEGEIECLVPDPDFFQKKIN